MKYAKAFLIGFTILPVLLVATITVLSAWIAKVFQVIAIAGFRFVKGWEELLK